MSEPTDPDCPRCRGGGCEWCKNTGRNPASFVDIAVRQSAIHAIMTFSELVAGCTPEERNALAWHLAMIRARRTYEELRGPKDV